MSARLPSLNGLRAFEAAARHLSFTQAASELNVTQTAISHQIRRLEEELGIRLFIRQNRALELTPEARDYLPGIRAAFNDLRLATDRLMRKKDTAAIRTPISPVRFSSSTRQGRPGDRKEPSCDRRRCCGTAS